MDQQQDNKQPSKDHNNQPQKKDKALKSWAIFSGIGIQMGLIIYLGNLLGSWIDKTYHTSFLEETITLIAVFAAMFLIVVRVNKLNK